MPGMVKRMPMPASSRRLFRRHTDTDAMESKSNRPRQKRSISIRRGRSSLSLSRFSSGKNSDPGVDEPPESTSDAASTCLTSVEESVFCDDTVILSSTVIDIHEHQHIEAKPPIHNRDDKDDEYSSFDDFFVNLLELIPCFPNNQTFDAHQRIKNDVDSDVMLNDFEQNTMKIECILENSIDEESGNHAPASHPRTDTGHMLSNKVLLPPVSEWTQEPLLLVATPGCSMHIRRIRCASDPSYFDSTSSPDSEVSSIYDNFKTDNSHAIQLPINNGKEDPSNTWVIDFETDVFAGTALFRIRGSNGWADQIATSSPESNNSTDSDYFGKHNRKFQMVVRGKFKSKVIMADCMSGLLLDRHIATSSSPNINCVDMDDLVACPPASNAGTEDTGPVSCTTTKSKRMRKLKRGKSSIDESLPSKWALRAAVKVAGVFSPRMDADLECSHPRVLSPLCSNAQTILISRKNGTGILSPIHETHAEPPCHSDASLVYDLNGAKKLDSSSSNSVQLRKRAFDAAYDTRVASLTKSSGEGDSSTCFDQDSEYTFEFLQHLVDYNNLSLDLGKVIGKLRLGGALRGQPVRFIAAVVNREDCKSAVQDLSMDDLDCLWSFDLWHKSLLP